MVSKTRRFRGRTRTHGRGKKAGRGKGKRGGSGNAGLKKHRFMSIVKINKNYFGVNGFTRHRSLINDAKIINLATLQNILPTLIKNGKAKRRGGAIHIDLGKEGYDKLLSKGPVEQNIRITIKAATKKAVEKIERAGGKVTLAK